MPGPDGQLINVSIVDCTNQLELKSYSGERVDIAALVTSKEAKNADNVATKKAAKEAAAEVSTQLAAEQAAAKNADNVATKSFRGCSSPQFTSSITAGLN